MAKRPPAKKGKRPLCREKTKAGKPCRNQSMPGSAFCSSHGGAGKVGAPERIHEPGLADKIIEAVEAGVTYEIAAQAAGIHKDTFAQWRRRGRAELDRLQTGEKPNPDETPYSDLITRLYDARAGAEVAILTRIRANAVDDWRAGAWILERRNPERWGKRDHVDVNVNESGKPRVVAPGKRDEILAVLAEATKAPKGSA